MTEVILKAVSTDPLIESGQYDPQRVLNEEPTKSIVILDAYDRISGNGCNFTIDLKSDIACVRKCRLAKLILPKIPQINPLNNEIYIVHEDGTASITLGYGFYNIVSLCNELTSKLNTAFGTLGDSAVIAYDPKTHIIEISSVGNKYWFFSSACSFILRGRSVHGFLGYDPGSNPISVGAVNQYSASCGLIYSTYITVTSRALQSYVKSVSMNSKGVQNIIASCSLVQSYTANDFDPAGVYTGAFIVESTLDDSPYFTVAGRNFSCLRVIDVSLYDQFGYSVYDSINIGATAPSFNTIAWLVFTS